MDDEGLDYIDHKMMAVSIGEERITIEDVYEPFLIQKGFIERTPRGRKATPFAYEHFKKIKE